ncbi:MAG: hypothetical protein HN368_16530 [Spirochaetales bacterium]|nr:hypothetical protein [Spirochaetales bacterium]
MNHGVQLIGFDLGTSAVKAVLTDTRGTILGKASRPVSLIHTDENYLEIDPDLYFDNVVDIIRELADVSGNPQSVKAISFAAASGNTLLLDSDYRPVMNTISWLDGRSAGKAAELWPELNAERIYQDAGWPWSGGFPLAHLAWIRDFRPDVWKSARYFAMNNDYLYYRLCGRLVVDPSKATTFYLQDQISRTWNTYLLDFLGVDESNLPEILPSGSAAGKLLADICEATGLTGGTMVVTGSFDHPSAARSTGIFEEGDVLISAGTSWVAFAPVHDRNIGPENGMIVDPFLSPQGCWGVMFALTAVAAKIDGLLKARFGDIPDLYARFDREAMKSEAGAGGLLIDPWKQAADEIADIGTEVDDSAFARAVMEGCAFLMKQKMDKLDGALESGMQRIVMVGGPTKSPVWPEILSAILGTRISIPETGAHAGALGAAIMAGIGTGFFTNLADGWEAMKSGERIIDPTPVQTLRYMDIYKEFCQKFELD